jgi:hypothetical protein
MSDVDPQSQGGVEFDPDAGFRHGVAWLAGVAQYLELTGIDEERRGQLVALHLATLGIVARIGAALSEPGGLPSTGMERPKEPSGSKNVQPELIGRTFEFEGAPFTFKEGDSLTRVLQVAKHVNGIAIEDDFYYFTRDVPGGQRAFFGIMAALTQQAPAGYVFSASEQQLLVAGSDPSRMARLAEIRAAVQDPEHPLYERAIFERIPGHKGYSAALVGASHLPNDERWSLMHNGRGGVYGTPAAGPLPTAPSS